jgi:calcium-independent phospholipase A2-gamma
MSPHAHYDGTSKYKVWEAVRASTCAPGYFEEFLLDENVFQVKENFIYLDKQFILKDGGLIANNPTSIALHECKLLWPGEDIQCVVSLGNGRPAPDVALQSKSMSCK